jgi:magnesium transporter
LFDHPYPHGQPESAAVKGHLAGLDGKELDLDREEIERLLGASVPFWLDLESTGDDCAEGGAIHELLRDTFKVHSLALEDAEHFGQRPKLDTYDDFVLLVAYGLAEPGHLAEVHCFCAPHYLVTVHRLPCPGIPEARKRVEAGGSPALIMVLYRVLDGLVDGFFPVLAELDNRIDELEDEILKSPTEDQLGQLFDMKRSLIALRKVVSPQRDVFATLISSDSLPGMTPEYEHYFRDVYDHLIRVSDLADSYRDLLSGAMDTHLSTVSNRLNVVMKQLTMIATVFLPLSFLTGFFGQNFAWMVDHLGGLGVFLAAGVGLQVVVAVVLVVLFRRRGWLASQEMVPPPAPATRARHRADLRWLAVHPPHPGAHRRDAEDGGQAAAHQEHAT